MLDLADAERSEVFRLRGGLFLGPRSDAVGEKVPGPDLSIDVQYVWRSLRKQKIDLGGRKSWCERATIRNLRQKQPMWEGGKQRRGAVAFIVVAVSRKGASVRQ